MQQIKLMSKFGLALIAVTAISVAVATQAYNIQAADAQAKLPNNSVRTETIVNGQVQTQDLASGAIKLNIHKVEGETIVLPAGFSGSASLDCPDGEVVTGGGFVVVNTGGSTENFVYPQSFSTVDENTWSVTAINQGSGENGFRAVAQCLDLTP